MQSYGLVYGYVRTRMSDEADAEDVVAEAFYKAARAYGRFDPTRAKFSTWVVTIARNCMISHYRKERPTVCLDDISEPVDTRSDDPGAVDDRDLALRLLGVLDHEEREIVLMKYREDMSNVQIAAELDMNPSTVATKVSRALAKMRNCAQKG